MLSPSALALAAALVAAPAAPAPAPATPAKAESPLASPETAVRDFYDFHLAHNKGLSAASLEERRHWLDDGLYRALSRYLKLPQKKDEVPAIDGDPFTDTQEYPRACSVDVALVLGDKAEVWVHFIGDGGKNQVRVALHHSQGAWRIADIWEGRGATKSLLAMLPK